MIKQSTLQDYKTRRDGVPAILVSPDPPQLFTRDDSDSKDKRTECRAPADEDEDYQYQS